MNGVSIGVVLLLLLGSGVGAFALMRSPSGCMMGGGSAVDCASMHPGMQAAHAQCAQEARTGSHAYCDPMGMSAAQCREMQSHTAGSAMSGPCH